MKLKDDFDKLDQTERFQNRIKGALRKYPFLYQTLVYTIGPALLLGPSSQKFINGMPPDALWLNIGAGVKQLKGNVIHLDKERYPYLHVSGDAHFLPFRDASFDGVICESLLEHVFKPDRVIQEMHRVMKPGGRIYVIMPFIFGFHAAPNDYCRFTHRGLVSMLRGFRMDRLKVVSGPTSALTCVLVEWCAILFSLGSRRLYRIFNLFFLLVFAPLKILDFMLSYHPEAVRIASVLLYIGTKE